MDVEFWTIFRNIYDVTTSRVKNGLALKRLPKSGFELISISEMCRM